LVRGVETARTIARGPLSCRQLWRSGQNTSTPQSWHNLIELNELRDKSEKAKEWQAKLAQTEAQE
jgi:hypothetical protein